MSQLGSENREGHDELAGEREQERLESAQMVPVSEAIRYRKRAQAAEQQLAEITREVEAQQQQRRAAQEQLAEAQRENEMTLELMKAGVGDVEAAQLLLRKRMQEGGGEPMSMGSLIEQLRIDKPYLFGDGTRRQVGLSGPTQGVRGEESSGRGVLSQQARRVRESNSPKEMQEYLRLRRSMK